MDIKDIKKAGIDDAERIKIKKIKTKTKGKETSLEEITVEREEESKFSKAGKKIKNFFKKFWHLLWKDDSLKGWIFSIIFLFVFIKFIFFPLLGLVTGTILPLAIVESCSMHHEGTIFSNFDNWWERHETKYENLGIEKIDFQNTIFSKFRRGFTKGDILFITGVKPENINIGDIILFNAGQQNPIIHRVIEINYEGGEYTFETIGDNNNGQLSFENSVNENQIIGKARFRIVPYLGWGKLIFFEHLRSESEKGICREN